MPSGSSDGDEVASDSAASESCASWGAESSPGGESTMLADGVRGALASRLAGAERDMGAGAGLGLGSCGEGKEEWREAVLREEGVCEAPREEGVREEPREEAREEAREGASVEANASESVVRPPVVSESSTRIWKDEGVSGLGAARAT